MFELGFPPVPTSIVNVNVDKRYAKDISQPFSLLEFIKIVSNIVDTNNITSYYNHYITLWNSNKNKQSSTSKNLIVEGYRNFIKDLTLNYNSQAENKFLSNIDYSDPYDLDVALKFIADKIQSIALYYRDKREDVKLESTRKKYKASTKGLAISIKERILEFLKNNNNKTIEENIDNVAKNLTVSIDPLYDGEAEYFNKTPNSNSYGSYDRDYNEDIFLKSNSELVAEIFSGLSNTQKELQEVDDIFNNKRDLTKKYMGTDFYYISATPVLSSAPILSINSDFNIRYNKDFIRLLTTTLPFTGVDVDSTTIPLTPKPPAPVTPNPNTTPAPINTSKGFESDFGYDCVAGTCLRRKKEKSKYRTKQECQQNCRPIIGGGGGGGDGNIKPDDKGPGLPDKIPDKCGCGNFKIFNTKAETINKREKCLKQDQYDEWSVVEDLEWDCESSDYEIEIRQAGLNQKTQQQINNPDAVNVKSPVVTRFKSTHKVPCGTDKFINIGTPAFRGTIIHKPTGKIKVCYLFPEIPVDVTPCCETQPLTSAPTSPSDIPTSPSGSELPCPPCPEDTNDTDNSETPPELPEDTSTVTPTLTSTPPGYPEGTIYVFPDGSYVNPSLGIEKLKELFESTTTPCPDCPPDYGSASSGIRGKYTPFTITNVSLGESSDSTVTSSTTTTTTTTPAPTSTTPSLS